MYRANCEALPMLKTQAQIRDEEYQRLEKEIRQALFPDLTKHIEIPPPRRQIEVELLVQRADGELVSFYYTDQGGCSALGAQVSASIKARKFNLKVIRVRNIEFKERPRAIQKPPVE